MTLKAVDEVVDTSDDEPIIMPKRKKLSRRHKALASDDEPIIMVRRGKNPRKYNDSKGKAILSELQKKPRSCVQCGLKRPNRVSPTLATSKRVKLTMRSQSAQN